MRQTSEVLVPREDLPIRGTEQTVGIEEKAQLREGSDEDLRWSWGLVMGIPNRRFSLSKFGFDKVSKASGVVVQETLWDGFTHLCRKWINLAYLLMIYL
jgi:hypothetical protein